MSQGALHTRPCVAVPLLLGTAAVATRCSTTRAHSQAEDKLEGPSMYTPLVSWHSVSCPPTSTIFTTTHGVSEVFLRLLADGCRQTTQARLSQRLLIRLHAQANLLCCFCCCAPVNVPFRLCDIALSCEVPPLQAMCTACAQTGAAVMSLLRCPWEIPHVFT